MKTRLVFNAELDRERAKAIEERDRAQTLLEALKTEMAGEANFGTTVDLLFGGPLREALAAGKRKADEGEE